MFKVRTHRFRSVAIASILLLAVATGCSSSSDDSKSSSDSGSSDTSKAIPLTIGYSAWPGWFPLAVADEAGIFKKAGLDVDLKYFADYTASLDALVAGQLDVNAQTLNDTIFAVSSGSDQKVVIVGDNSTGNDQIICDKSVGNQITDIRGKSVAAEAGVVDHFLLLQGLAKENMTEDDISFKGLATADAAAAFAGGQFDCVGVFAPFTLTAAERAGSHVLFSSKDFPGVIPDHLVATADAAKNTAAMQRLVKAWYQTLDYIKANPEKSIEIMAKKAGISTTEYENLDKGTTLFTAAQSANAFKDRPGDPTSVVEMARRINPFLVESGLAEKKADLSGLFEPKFTDDYASSSSGS